MNEAVDPAPNAVELTSLVQILLIQHFSLSAGVLLNPTLNQTSATVAATSLLIIHCLLSLPSVSRAIASAPLIVVSLRVRWAVWAKLMPRPVSAARTARPPCLIVAALLHVPTAAPGEVILPRNSATRAADHRAVKRRRWKVVCKQRGKGRREKMANARQRIISLFHVPRKGRIIGMFRAPRNSFARRSAVGHLPSPGEACGRRRQESALSAGYGPAPVNSTDQLHWLGNSARARTRRANSSSTS